MVSEQPTNPPTNQLSSWSIHLRPPANRDHSGAPGDFRNLTSRSSWKSWNAWGGGQPLPLFSIGSCIVPFGELPFFSPTMHCRNNFWNNFYRNSFWCIAETTDEYLWKFLGWPAQRPWRTWGSRRRLQPWVDLTWSWSSGTVEKWCGALLHYSLLLYVYSVKNPCLPHIWELLRFFYFAFIQACCNPWP